MNLFSNLHLSISVNNILQQTNLVKAFSKTWIFKYVCVYFCLLLTLSCL